MKKITLRKVLLAFAILILSVIFIPKNIYATENDLDVDGFNIIPELDDEWINKVNKAIEEIWQTWSEVMNTYNQKALTLTTSEQISSWIMNWDTFMNYLVYIVQFLSQLWLVIWTIFIIYAWYQYMLSVFKWWKVPSSSIKNAITWIIIVIFSFAIMRTLTSIIWLT